MVKPSKVFAKIITIYYISNICENKLVVAICLQSKIREKRAWAKVFTAKNKKCDTEFWSDFSFTLFRVQFEQCFLGLSHESLGE